MYALYSDEVYDDIALCNAVGIAARTIKPRDKVEQTQNIDIRIYPNPSTGTVFINMPAIEGSTSVEIIDVLGRVLQTESIYSTSNTIKLEVADGVYQIRILNNGNVLSNQKLIINKF
jgi:hypothetical protein